MSDSWTMSSARNDHWTSRAAVVNGRYSLVDSETRVVDFWCSGNARRAEISGVLVHLQVGTTILWRPEASLKTNLTQVDSESPTLRGSLVPELSFLDSVSDSFAMMGEESFARVPDSMDDKRFPGARFLQYQSLRQTVWADLDTGWVMGFDFYDAATGYRRSMEMDHFSYYTTKTDAAEILKSKLSLP